MPIENPLEALALVHSGPTPLGARAAAILLHGRGHNTGSMLALAERILLPLLPFIAIPAANQTWYPASFLAAREENQPHLDWALARIDSVVRELEKNRTPRERIALIGFSQGACLASEFIFRSGGKWGALVALTGGLIGPPGTKWEGPKPSLRGTKALFATSANDSWVPLARVEESAAVFREMGADVSLRVDPNREHIVSDEEIVLTRELLLPLLQDERGA